ncbi:adenylosuccinate lyase [Candidatus Gottesmanbacteria bacterium]|nr:adenylosuccinate lyase [Candidatus Gottesmanbacteria bacterium]
MLTDIKNKLLAVTLLDGRNRDKMQYVSEYFSELALIKYRVRVEISYLIFLTKETKIIRNLNQKEISFLQNIWQKFNIEDAIKVKEFEAKINHDVKAIEYFLQQKLEKTSLFDIIPFIHFGLTSYDVNIPSYALMLSDFRKNVFTPIFDKLLKSLLELIIKTKGMNMLAKTHGQPALPTTMSKELTVYYQRLKKERKIFTSTAIEAKVTGAVGNFNALQFSVPHADWILLSKKFIQSLGLVPNIFTTQILPYDSWLQLFDSIKRTNNILLGFVQDIWWYISFEYFVQKIKLDEVGSSTMSHKVNPITFENAEGNLGMANAIFEFFTRKLSYSRLQRDLSDSTVKRNFGLAFGFTILSWDSILSGFSRISPNPVKMKEDLNNHWEIFAEGIQTYLRAKGYKAAFELLKEKTRGKFLGKEEIYKLINDLPISNQDKKKLKIKDLSEYAGLAEKLAELAIEE